MIANTQVTPVEERMTDAVLFTQDHELEIVWRLLDEVKDPEIPVVSIRELGILRDIGVEKERIVVTITPTYSGCPAMDTITQDICQVLEDAGFKDHEVRLVLSPAWTTDWMSEIGRRKLEEYGIAAPHKCGQVAPVQCPRCQSEESELISEFGSTACKSMYRCGHCKEAFCYFKAI